MGDEPLSPTLQSLYDGLAAAHTQGEDHQAALKAALPQLQAKGQELQQQRQQVAEGSPQAAQIDAELEQIGDAILAAREQLDQGDDDEAGDDAG